MAEVQAIPSRTEWDALPTKQDKKDMMVLMRKEYPDKDIRDAWGMNPGSFYNLLYRYGLAGKDADEAGESVQRGETGQGKGVRRNTGQRGPGRPRGSGKGKTGRRKDVIDAEYHVIHEGRSEEPPVAPEAQGNPTPPTHTPEQKGMALATIGSEKKEQVGLPFPTITGKISQLRKQFEGILMFLEGQSENEEDRFEIRIGVYKA